MGVSFFLFSQYESDLKAAMRSVRDLIVVGMMTAKIRPLTER